jgi:aminobenzoyl-glutamate utilization protein B
MSRRRIMSTPSTLSTLGLSLALAGQAAPTDAIVPWLDARAEAYGKIAHQIWEFAEVGYQEQKSSALLQQHLREAGFTVEAGVAEIPTAFVATWGSGKPVIAFIGEFDALPGLSQQPVPDRKPVVAGGPGHGCGHHLLGTGSLAAAVAVKEWLAANRRSATIRYYGTPAEEGGSGKVYMVRAGLFKDVDAVIAWHPGDGNGVDGGSTLANITGKFRFHGVSAHAAGAPERGRSALDGLEAMTFMINLMREHVPQETRLHYVITRGGGAPNVVPDFAELYLYARHPDMRVLDAIWDRLLKAGEGAALGTGTRMEYEITGAVHNLLTNATIGRVMHDQLTRVGGVRYSPQEETFAAELRKSFDAVPPERNTQERIDPVGAGVSSASTDLSDVSWNVPTAHLGAATYVPGTPGHSWQATACGGMSIGRKGMMVAAKTLALTAAAVLNDPQILAAARQEFDRKREGFTYKTRLADRKPALDYRK